MPSAASEFSGSLRSYFFDEWVVHLSDDTELPEHKHGVMQLSISLTDEPHEVATKQRGTVRAPVHLVGPNVPHVLVSRAPVLSAWIEPDSELGRRLSHAYLSGSDHATPDQSPWSGLATEDLARALDERWLADAFRPVGGRLYDQLLDNLDVPPALHAGVQEALRTIRADPSVKHRAADLARRVGLSESRFLHLFSEHVGVPLRGYLRWCRVLGAQVRMLTRGVNATEAAVAMGFSDSAHMTRVMTEFMALPPSWYVKKSEGRIAVVDCT